ncbi:uncharacterized protein LOC110702437 isoform X2 [Chenopodium quinoa]|uniref:uncharacterized protein LOC110702437 isoform X2 n=1 Tax=Chenopodium quinoa TaxID=63459 RepID=UPI000B78DD22|nr:uncharacterized protein LOC110702437 isoform X2 [Chenopodium quinoa]
MLPISRCDSTPISTKKRQKLKDEGESMHQDDAATKSSKMLSIKRGGSCSRGTGKWQKMRAQLDMSLHTGETSTRPITRALSQKQELKSQDSAKIFNLDDSSFMGGSCIKIISEDETLKRCPSVDIIEIESSAENSGLQSNLNELLNDNSAFISRAIVKDEISDTNENDNRLGSPEIGINGEQPMEAQPEKGPSQLIVSEHENICPQLLGDSLTAMLRDSSRILSVTTNKQGIITKDSVVIDHGLRSSNRIGFTSGGQSMDPQPEEGQSESISHNTKMNVQDKDKDKVKVKVTKDFNLQTKFAQPLGANKLTGNLKAVTVSPLLHDMKMTV